MPRLKPEVADIFRAHGAAYPHEHAGYLNLPQLKVMSAIANCQTAAFGGHVAACTKCDHLHIAYNACRNRHCATCQGAAAHDWMQARMEDLLPVAYVYVVFTLPSHIADIAYQNKGSVVQGVLRNASDDRSRSQTPRGRNRHDERAAYIGVGDDTSSITRQWFAWKP